jgi:GntR family transcriptional repressor for pyruvate dehydrogenase complex
MIVPIRPKKVYAQVVEQIVDLIEVGDFAIGTQLPTERELAKRLGVGRASLREALSALQILGFVETKHGQGTFVRSDAASLSLPSEANGILAEESPFTILEARIAFEPSIAALAARERSDEALAHIEGILVRVRDDVRNVDVVGEGDRDFHYSIAEATGNPVIMAAMASIRELMAQKMWLALVRTTNFATSERWERALGQHWAVYESVKGRQPQVAFTRMKSHLDEVMQLMTESEMDASPGAATGSGHLRGVSGQATLRAHSVP